MEVHAYPTEAAVPVDLAEARRIADLHLTDPGDAAAGISTVVTEFDTGFTVVAVFGAGAAQKEGLQTEGLQTEGLPPPAVGGSVCVIDKSTGAVSYWPSYPTALVAEQYTEMLRTGRLVIEDGWPDPDDIGTEDTDTEDVHSDDASGDVTIDYESS
ncbi:hypothetical protein [Nocardia sp. NPDC005366]|uniref:hypothetical protein n=1 Tax=Nocardia sp. NPDC005366 TaxID=3156878 RepID=UPI0033BEB33C